MADDLGLGDLQADLAAWIVRAFRSGGLRRLLEFGKEISGRVADIGGVPQQVYGTACMTPDGSWPIVSE